MALIANVAFAKEPISSVAIGVYEKDEKQMLEPAFIKAVNDYLHRYEPRLIRNEGDYVKMRANYGVPFDIELKVNAEDFEIKATLVHESDRRPRRRKQAEHLASGVFKVMEDNLRMRPSRRKA
jgi:hypothetical protein